MSREELGVPVDFALPVYKTDGPFREKIPLGAPRAFVTGENQVVNCTLWPFWLRQHRGRSSSNVLGSLRGYFWSHRNDFLSFVAIPIRISGKSLAVINIHCKWFRVLGKNPDMVVDVLLPLILVLSYIYEKEKEPA
jgi:hypothetical protein